MSGSRSPKHYSNSGSNQHITSRNSRSLADMDMYVPDLSDTSAPPKGALASPAQRAVEEIKRQAGIIDRHLRDMDLKQAEESRLDELQEQYTNLATWNSEMTTWLNMIQEALQHYDQGELSARQFANEVEAAIKGWEGK